MFCAHDSMLFYFLYCYNKKPCFLLDQSATILLQRQIFYLALRIRNMGIALIDALRNYKDSESSIESLTSESKLILIYISIVCVILLSSLIIMICWGCEIVGKDKLILRSNTRTFNDGSGKEIKVMHVRKSNSLQLPVTTSTKIERMFSV